jgi:hypothetical protein
MFKNGERIHADDPEDETFDATKKKISSTSLPSLLRSMTTMKNEERRR